MRKSNKEQRRSSPPAAGGTPSPSRSQDGSRSPMDLTPSHYHSPVRHYDNNATGLPRDPEKLSLDTQDLPGLYGRLVDYSPNTPYCNRKLERLLCSEEKARIYW